MPEIKPKAVGKKKLGVYVTLTSEQRSKLDEIGKRALFQSDAAGDVLRIYINKHWTEIVAEKTGEPDLFPES
jgi:hypothetical protein